jgi:hypothetical protein
VHEHVVAAIFALNEAEAFLGVEELHLALGFADHLGGHAAKAAATTTAAAARTAAKAAAAIAAAEAATTAAAEAAAITAAKSATVTIRGRRRKSVEIILAKSVAFVPAPAAPTPVKTHAELFTFNVVLDHLLKNRADVNPIAQLQVGIRANLATGRQPPYRKKLNTPQRRSMKAAAFSTQTPTALDQKPVEEHN